MRKRDHLKAWLNHAALNAGAALECLAHVVVPPQVDHEPVDVESLSKSDPVTEFFVGVGILERPGASVPVNAIHATCPSCDKPLDVVPAEDSSWSLWVHDAGYRQDGWDSEDPPERFH